MRSSLVVTWLTTMASSQARLEQLASELLAPLVERDGGQLYLVDASDLELSIHLTGRFSGCAGNELVIQNVLQPAVQAGVPGAHLRVTSGPLIPPGARRLAPRP